VLGSPRVGAPQPATRDAPSVAGRSRAPHPRIPLRLKTRLRLDLPSAEEGGRGAPCLASLGRGNWLYGGESVCPNLRRPPAAAFSARFPGGGRVVRSFSLTKHRLK